MTLSRPDAEDVSAAKYIAHASGNGWRYVAPEMTVETIHRKCSDGMSERIFKEKVAVTVDGLELQGCGGGILPPEMLEGSAWWVKAINDVDLPTNSGAEFRFSDGRMSGSIGCNRLAAGYKFQSGVLSFEPIMSTKMACPDPVGKQEFMFVTVLGNLASTEFPGDGSMVLNGKDGSKIVLIQSI